MKISITSQPRNIAFILLVLVLTLTSSSMTRAQSIAGGTDSAPAPEGTVPNGGGVPVPGGPGYVTVSAWDFKPMNQANTYAYAGIQLINTGNSGDLFIANFDIPNGATITKMVVYYADSDPLYDLNVNLMRLPFFGSSPISIAMFTASGPPNGNVYGETTNISNPVVDLASYSYGLEVELPRSVNLKLTAVRIDYAFYTALPGLTK